MDSAKQSILGWIPYWNLFPLKKELQRQWGSQVQLAGGHPVTVNKMLAEGRIQLAPCSSICLLTSSGNEMAMPLGVGCLGPVHSVYLAIHGQRDEEQWLTGELARRDTVLREMFSVALTRFGDDVRGAAQWVWERAQTQWGASADQYQVLPALRLTSASASSAALAKLMYQLWFGVDASRAILVGQGAEAAENNRLVLELVIGDEALQRRSQFHRVIDLGDHWLRMTGLPFVFAVWQKSTTTALTPQMSLWRQRIWEASEIAQARMKVDPTFYIKDSPVLDDAGREIDLAGYWKSIDYRLTPAHLRGLLLYLSLAGRIIGVDNRDSAVAKIIIWQERAVADFL